MNTERNHIVINDKIFLHFLSTDDCSYYRCEASRQQVGVRWSEYYEWFRIECADNYFAAVGRLELPMYISEIRIPNYFTAEDSLESDRLIRSLHETL